MRRRIAVVVVAVSALVAMAFVIPLGFLVRRTAEDRAIDRARIEANAVVPVIVAGGSAGDLASTIALVPSGAAARMTVVTSDGLIVGPTVRDSEALSAALEAGVSSVNDISGGKEVVTAIAADDGELSAIRIFVPDGELRDGQWAAWLALIAVAGVLVGLSVLVADRLARSIVRPTQRLAGAAERLGSGDLEARVVPEGPEELIELSHAFNDLASRVSVMLENERELVAELSHRLRTPLTALSMRLDAVDDPELAHDLRADVDRLSAVVDELISEARDRRKKAADAGCDAAAVVAERVEFWAVLAQDQGRSWRFEREPGAAHVPVASGDLLAALDVLIENVFTHTDEGVGMQAWVRRSDSTVRIGVADSGPGFDPDLVAAGRSGNESTGLGLSIARRTAEGAGGKLEVARNHETMVVELVVPQMNGASPSEA